MKIKSCINHRTNEFCIIRKYSVDEFCVLLFHNWRKNHTWKYFPNRLWYLVFMKLNELEDEVKLLATDGLKRIDILIRLLGHSSEELWVFWESLVRYFILDPIVGIDIDYPFHHLTIIIFRVRKTISREDLTNSISYSKIKIIVIFIYLRQSILNKGPTKECYLKDQYLKTFTTV